jgi:hypothetical protein
MSPKTEWDRIDTEPATPQGLFTGYAMILAAIPAVAGLIGGMFPVCVLGVCVHMNIISLIVGTIVMYVGGLAAVYAIALAASEVASSFEGQKNTVQALKLIVYSWTAAWVGGILAIVPMLGMLALLAVLYSFYLLYVGAPRLMKVPESKVLGYVAVVAVIGIVIMGIIGAIAGHIESAGMIGGGVRFY